MYLFTTETQIAESCRELLLWSSDLADVSNNISFRCYKKVEAEKVTAIEKDKATINLTEAYGLYDLGNKAP